MNRNIDIATLIVFILLLMGCNHLNQPLFEQLPSSRTGIQFSNTIIENEQYNIFEFMNIYTGAGVAAGDINNDGLADLYFSGNMVSGKLYLNKGNLVFEDITEAAGLVNKNWGTGVSMVDINQDGWLDIYVCVSGPGALKERANLLYVNNGDNTFSEKAGEYGIADIRQTMHASFFDYDRDGDLDLFMIVNPADYLLSSVNSIRPRMINGEAKSVDILYKNNGNNTFTDVSKESGILVEGYSLGVSISDINQDDWPDIYISNDFLSNDILYINNQDGTFADRTSQYLKHTSFAGMGNDVADYNNDGLVDILVLDMLPGDNKRQKLIIPAGNYDKFHLALKMGYDPQYTRNTLQLNRGNGLFSEVGFLSGISKTDWSWSALFADYDNDGDKDLFVTNGFLRDLGNLDYIHYQQQQQAYPAGNLEGKLKQKLEQIKKLNGAELKDYFFENNGDMTFSNRSEAWGIDQPGFSNGAAYVDLDNDGDLDLVVNNINNEAHIYENKANKLLERHFLRIKLNGNPQNRNGIGTKLWVRYNGKLQFYEHFLYRGYESTVDQVIHFGLDDTSAADSIEIVWPDGRYQLIKNVRADQLLTLHHQNAGQKIAEEKGNSKKKLFTEVTDRYGIKFKHRENEHVDFKVQPLLPHMHSRNGPGIAVEDVNADGLEDFYIGGASGQAGRLFLQEQNGQFSERLIHNDSAYEDMGCLFFDADNDGYPDLYVVSGGSRFEGEHAGYQDRLYKNDGHGNFVRDDQALPKLEASGFCVAGADYDNDGDMDLFIGGRILPGSYPLPARSYLLENRGGKFIDVTDDVNRDLSNMGLVTAALWTDFDNDKQVDLIVVGEWMPVRFFKNISGKLREVTSSTGLKGTHGWWNSLKGGDFDNDGDMDYLVGNQGLNNNFEASEEEPVCIYAKDYDKNGRIDPVMCCYVQGKNYPAHSRDIMIDQMNAMRVRFKTYENYASVTFDEAFLKEELRDAYVVKSERFASSYIENLGGGKFSIKALPIEAQFAPVFGILTGDYNGDGNLDALLVGNSYSTEVSAGRHDASVGTFIAGDGLGNFNVISPSGSGFVVDEEAKDIAILQSVSNKRIILIANNSDSVKAFSISEKLFTAER